MCNHSNFASKRGLDDKWQKFSSNLKMAAGLNMEEISGTIQNSLADVGKDENSSRIKQWIDKRRSQLKPWTEFMNAKAFSKPKDVAQASRRIVKNLDAYQTNYIAICLFLAIYCIITSPMLLFALGISSGACYYVSKRGQGQKIKLFGREYSVAEQYALILTISLPLLFFASAGSAVFWVIGASVFVIMLHASLTEPPNSEPEIELDEVKSIQS